MKKDTWVGFLPFYLLVTILVIGAIFGSSHAVTTINESSFQQERICYIIDAGHGGIDGGATSCTDVLESALNLEISLRLDDLMHFLGYRTKMIRTTDTSIYTQGNTIAAQKVSDLKERVRIVNESENNVLISIHQNTFSDSQYSGAQVFYSPGNTERVMAQSLQNNLNQFLNLKSQRKPKIGEGIYLLQHISRPGVLIECGFLSNPEEEAKLRNDTYQKKLCAVIATSITRFLTAEN